MTFAGLSNPQDRANVIAFLNSRSDAPQPLPAATAEAAAAPAGEAPARAAPANADKADAGKPGTGTEPGPQKAEDEPATAKKPGGGEAAQPAH
jgi:cytochrome c